VSAGERVRVLGSLNFLAQKEGEEEEVSHKTINLAPHNTIR
jgi:hypothetical protein